MNVPIAVDFTPLGLAFPNQFGNGHVFIQAVFPVKIAVISTAGNFKEIAHLFYAISLSKNKDDLIFQSWLHFLPTADRKFRNSSFSIFNRLIICS